MIRRASHHHAPDDVRRALGDLHLGPSGFNHDLKRRQDLAATPRRYRCLRHRGHGALGGVGLVGVGPTAGLQLEEKKRVERFLKAQMERLLANKGVTPLIKHEIRLEDHTPIRQRYRPRNPATERIIDEEVDKMLQ